MKQRKKIKIRIWLFDDEKMVLESLRELFEAFGFEVFCFQSPVEVAGCLKVMNSEVQTDVVITDIQMPEMDGMELVEKLALTGFDKKNIAMISGFWTEEYQDFARKFKIKMFDKPFEFKKLLPWLEERRCGTENNCLIFDFK